MFWVPLMRVIGKRPVFLVSLPILVATNLWASKTHNFNSLLASQIVSGFAGSAAEGSVLATAADIFFVHERGTMLMIFHMAISFGAMLGPLMNSYVVQVSAGFLTQVVVFGDFWNEIFAKSKPLTPRISPILWSDVQEARLTPDLSPVRIMESSMRMDSNSSRSYLGCIYLHRP